MLNRPAAMLLAAAALWLEPAILAAQQERTLAFAGVSPGVTSERELLANAAWGQPLARAAQADGITAIDFRFTPWPKVTAFVWNQTVGAIDVTPPDGTAPERLAEVLELGSLVAVADRDDLPAGALGGAPLLPAWQALRCSETPGVAIFFEEAAGAKRARLLRFYTLERRLSDVLRFIPPDFHAIAAVDAQRFVRQPAVLRAAQSIAQHDPQMLDKWQEITRELADATALARPIDDLDYVAVALQVDFTRTGTPGYMPRIVAAATFRAPLDRDKIVRSLDPKFVPVRRDGKTYYVWADLNQILYLPDDRTIVIATADLTDAQIGHVLRDGGPLSALSPTEVASIAEIPAGDARLLLRRSLMQPLFALAAEAAGPRPDERRQREQMEYATLSELTDVALGIRGDRLHGVMRYLCRDEAGARRVVELEEESRRQGGRELDASLAQVPEPFKNLLRSLHEETEAKYTVEREGNVTISSTQVAADKVVTLIDQGFAASRAAQNAAPQVVPDPNALPPIGPPQVGDVVEVNGDSTTLNDGDNVIAIVPKGTRIRVEQVNGEWLLIETNVGGVNRKGWISRGQVTRVAPAAPK
ncbi:MAG: hypothetical protein WD069_19895 [Planctomycetales bacterium]